MLKRSDFTIKNLGDRAVESPLVAEARAGRMPSSFIDPEERLLFHGYLSQNKAAGGSLDELPSFEAAGPFEKIFFDPKDVCAGIVTCGGLCPGLNDVIRALTLQLHYVYGVRRIKGFQYGYQGFIPEFGHDVLDLDPEAVDGLQDLGGTMLRSSRGNQDIGRVVDRLVELGVNILFTIGGDGTLRGAQAIGDEIERRGLKIAVVGVPKTIDNDIMYVGESFGFQTAYTKAVEAIKCAHVESKGAPNGIGIVKLMGRHSGFIACHATLAMSDVNFVLIPEVPFELEGENGFLKVLEDRLRRRQHAVIAVAEGAGQDLLGKTAEKDKSGNTKLQDIGLFLKEKIAEHFASIDMPASIKYIDPSYIIRSVPANAQDSAYCMQLAQCAVHAAMAGKTEMVIGRYHGYFVHIPIDLAVSERKQVDPQSDLWMSVLASTGQPMQFARSPG